MRTAVRPIRAHADTAQEEGRVVLRIEASGFPKVATEVRHAGPRRRALPAAVGQTGDSCNHRHVRGRNETMIIPNT